LLPRLIGLTLSPGLPGLVRLSRPVRLILTIRLSGPVLLTGLIGPLQIRLPLQAWCLLATLDDQLAPDLLGGKCLPHKGAVARGLLRRNLQRYRGEPPSRAGPDRKAGRAARQCSELGAAGAEHLDPSNRSVGVWI
jgi:hypothetical protein